MEASAMTTQRSKQRKALISLDKNTSIPSSRLKKKTIVTTTSGKKKHPNAPSSRRHSKLPVPRRPHSDTHKKQ
jgi:hypothetical protein